MVAPAIMANLAKNLPMLLEVVNAAQAGTQLAQTFSGTFPNGKQPQAIGDRPGLLGQNLAGLGGILSGATESAFGVMTLNPFKAFGGAAGIAGNAMQLGYNNSLGLAMRPMADIADRGAYAASFGADQMAQMSNRSGEQAALGAAGDAVQVFTKKVGDAATNPSFAKMADLAVSIVNLVPLIENMGEAIQTDIRKLDGFSASMSYANRLIEMESIQRNLREASATGGTSVEVVKGLNDLKRTLEPIRHDITNLVNIGMTGLLSVGKMIAQVTNNLWQLVKETAPHVWFISGYAKAIIEKLEKAEREGKMESAKAARGFVEKVLVGKRWLDPKEIEAKK